MRGKVFESRFYTSAILLIVFAVFFGKSYITLDPDFGWHVRMGEVILTSGVPKTDPFSYTMPSFPFVDHEWLTNSFFYLGQNLLGRFGMSFLFVLLALGVFLHLFVTKGNKANFPLLILAAAALLPFTGVRPQVLSWFLLGLLTVATWHPKWQKLKHLFPLLMLLWVNLHGSFPIALVVLLAHILANWIRSKRINFTEIVLIIVSFLTTFINPYGIRIWEEVIRQMGDTNLRWSIAEWQPALFVFNFPLIAYSVFSVALVARFYKRLPAETIIIYVLFLLQGIATVRHIPLWLVVSLPVTLLANDHFAKTIPAESKERYQSAISFMLSFSAVIFITSCYLSIRSAAALSEAEFYPNAATVYLAQNKPTRELFSNYAWGGYLIWKLPDQKVFIDGRMPSWRWAGNPESESAGAFDNYKQILTGEVDYKEVFDKYGVTTVLWPAERKDSLWGRLTSYVANLVGKSDAGFDLVEALKQDGWQLVYEDAVAVVYARD